MTLQKIQFLLCCIKISEAEQRHQQLLQCIEQIDDWEPVLDAATRHGLIPLMHLRLKETIWSSLPEEVRTAFETAQRENATRALSFTSEMLRLMRLLQSQHIFALPYKGPALAMQLYGDVAMRQYGDIDVVINSHDVQKVTTLMTDNGWNKEHNLTPAQTEIYIRNYNDYPFYTKSQLFEMHWEFAAKAYAFPLTFADVQTRCNRIQIAGAEVPSLAPEDLLLVLCFHGATHAWERLGWLADISQLLSLYPRLNWEAVIEKASQLHCLRILNFSLHLASQLLNVSLPETIQQMIRQDQSSIRLAQQVEDNILSDRSNELGYWKLVFFHVKMRERWMERFQYCWYTMFRVSVEDWVSLPLDVPPALSFIYYPIRFIRVFKRYILQQF